MPGMIGASLEDLNASAQGFGAWSPVARESGTFVVSTVQGAVSALEAETTRAQITCIDSIEGMKSTLIQAFGTLTAAEYVGQNAVVARDAAADMDSRCAQAVTDMTAAFDEFRTQIGVLSESITEIATGYDRYAAGASESGEGMNKALLTQAENLEAAMTGMTYGG